VSDTDGVWQWLREFSHVLVPPADGDFPSGAEQLDNHDDISAGRTGCNIHDT
jgi:hypothetical protein